MSDHVFDLDEADVLCLAKELFFMYDDTEERKWDSPDVAGVRQHCMAHARYLLAQYTLTPKFNPHLEDAKSIVRSRQKQRASATG